MASFSNPPPPLPPPPPLTSPPAGEPPSDEQLSAWLDGELPAEAMARIEQWLQAHPDDAARVRLWAADREALQARLGPLIDEAVPQAWRQQVMQAQRRRQPLPLAWAAGLLLAGGAIGGLVAAGIVGFAARSSEAQLGQAPTDRPAAVAQAPSPSPSPSPGPAAPAMPAEAPAPGPADGAQSPVLAAALAPWLHRAAVAHAVYVPEVRHAVEVPVDVGDPAQQAAQAEHLSRWLSKRLAMPVRLFDLSGQGFALMGGRLLPDARAPSAQLMYQDGEGHRVTLYLRRPDGDAETAFAFGREGRLGLFYWSEPGYGCAVVGELPRERLLAVAQAVYQQFEAESAALPGHRHPPAPSGLHQGPAPDRPAPALSAARPMS